MGKGNVHVKSIEIAVFAVVIFIHISSKYINLIKILILVFGGLPTTTNFYYFYLHLTENMKLGKKM